jgi:DNA-binding MarR family transcriptional regulator
MASTFMPRYPVSLRGSWFGLNHEFRQRLKALSITPVQYTTLRNICEFQGEVLNQRTLSEFVISNENNLTAILQKLEKHGLIARKISTSDRRSKTITPTPRGKEIFKVAQVIARELEHEILAEFSDSERETLLAGLEVCSQKLQEIGGASGVTPR